jgi:magnesium chelatase family protein
MPLAKSYAISLVGLTGTVVEVEADISSNLPGFVLVGLPDASLSEASAQPFAAKNHSQPVAGCGAKIWVEF